jgi:molybdopterin converting factor small subunit
MDREAELSAAAPGVPSGVVTVRYFAGAQAAAGVPEERLPATGPVRLEDLAAELGRRHGPGLARVLAASAFLVDEVPGPRDRVVPTGATVDVLPPFAGG